MFLRPVRTAQPQGPAQVDASHPLAKGLLLSMPLASNFASIGPDCRVAASTGAINSASKGMSGTAFDGNAFLSLGTKAVINAATPCCFTIYEKTFAVGTFTALLGLTATGSSNQFLFLRGTQIAASSYTCVAGPTNSGFSVKNFTQLGPQVAGEKIRFLVMCPNGLGSYLGIRIWANGVELTAQSDSNFGAGAAGTSYLGWDGYDNKFNGLLADFHLWGRLLSDGEIRSYFANPQQIYQPTARSLWVPVEVGTGGGTSYTLPADTTGLTLIGTAAALKSAYKLTASSAALTLAGQSATLTHTPGPVAYSLTATSAALTLASQTATLKSAHKLPAASAALTLAGQDAELTHVLGSAGYGLVASSAALTLSGQAATLKVASKLPATTAALTLVSQPATLKTAHKLPASSAAITLTGQAATLLHSTAGSTNYSLTADTVALTLTGQAATFRAAHKFAADSTAFDLAAQAAVLRSGFGLLAGSAGLTLTGQDAALTYMGSAPGVAVYPPPDKVLLNVTYGPTGADYTGTATGGSGPSAADIAAAVWQQAVRTLSSSAAPSAEENAVAVRAELAAELARVDTSISSRLADATYVAPVAGDGAEVIAAAVRAELADELSRMDATVSSRATPASVWGYTQ